MSFKSRLDKAYRDAPRIRLAPTVPLVFMSDLHENDGGPADDFVRLDPLCSTVMSGYRARGFTVVTLGDIEDIWECPDRAKIRIAHPAVEGEKNRLREEGRLIEIDGNHDMSLKNHKAVVLQIGDMEIFCIHGHQGDLLNDRLWWVGQYFVRYLWVPLQWLGISDPTKRKAKKHATQEKRLREWAFHKPFITAFGHVHRLVDGANCFSSGSWVCQDGEAVEYANGKFTLKTF